MGITSSSHLNAEVAEELWSRCIGQYVFEGMPSRELCMVSLVSKMLERVVEQVAEKSCRRKKRSRVDLRQQHALQTYSD